MDILKKDKWWVWLLLLIGSQGASNIVLGALAGVFNRNEWYAKLKNWLMYSIPIGIIFILIFGAGFSLIDKTDLVELEGLESITALGFIVLIPLCLLYGFGIVFTIFTIQILAKTAAALDVPGKEMYLSPYVWVLFVIVPIIGWILLVVMLIYINIWPLVMLYRGAGEKYVK